MSRRGFLVVMVVVLSGLLVWTVRTFVDAMVLCGGIVGVMLGFWWLVDE